MSIPPPPGPHQPQGPYPPGPFTPPGPWGYGYGGYAQPVPVNGVAIAALVLGILCFLPAVGLVLGLIALAQIKRKGERGKGMAIAGAVLSTVGLVLWTVSLSTGVASDVVDGLKDAARGEGTAYALAKGDCFDSGTGSSRATPTTSTRCPAPAPTTARCSPSSPCPRAPSPATTR